MFTIQNIVISLILLIIILLFVRYFFCEETFSGSLTLTNSTFDNMVGLDKNIQFSVMLNGKEYYLIAVKKGYCGIIENNPKDCSKTVLILKEKEKYEKDISLDKIKHEDDKKICNQKQESDCKFGIKKTMIEMQSTSEAESEAISMESKIDQKIRETCKTENDICNKLFLDNSYFSILNIPEHFDKKSTNKLYQIVNKIMNDGGMVDIKAISKFHVENNLELICLDGNSDYPRNTSSVEFEEVISQTANSDLPKSYYIKFKLPKKIGNTDVIRTHNGEVVYEDHYVGMCKDLKCQNESDNYFRLCLYNSLENPHVLKFMPKLITK